MLRAQTKSKLTGSQSCFLDFPRKGQCDKTYSVYQEMVAGGYASGKTWSGLQKGLFLSALYPGNEGMICRLHGSDLVKTVIPEFFKQCPKGWIRKVQNRDRSNMVVHLVNGSIIYFQHIRDAGQKGVKTRRTGHNLGWFLVEQAEEITEAEWIALNGRLRNSRAKVRFALGNANPSGSDWLQKMFFPKWKPLDPKSGVYFRTYVNGNRIGIHVDSEENRVSNGGFVDDGFYENYLLNSPQDWIDRYIHASFADFTGKVYKEYSLDSVHNISPLPYVPSNWECLGTIDVGGVCAWSVLKIYADETGNLIVAKEFDKATSLVTEVGEWIRREFTPGEFKNTTFVIDPENKVAATDLVREGVSVRPAQKNVIANIQRVSGYLHLVKRNVNVGGRMKLIGVAPAWLREHDPGLAERIEREGCPRLFVYETCTTWRKEHAEVLWHEKIPNQIKKTMTERFDTCFVAGTPVLMEDGTERAIELIKAGEKVWTRNGVREVLGGGLTQRDAVLVRVNLSNGRTITCTPEHRFWVGGGWRQADTLGYGDRIYSCDPKRLFTKELSLDSIKASSTTGLILREEPGKSINTSGSAILETALGREDLTSITGTTTGTLTNSPISNVSLQPRINLSIPRKSQSGLLRQERGIAPLRERNGILSTENVQWKNEKLNDYVVSTAEKPIGQEDEEGYIAATPAVPCGEGSKERTTSCENVFSANKISPLINIPKPSIVLQNAPIVILSVERLERKADVYCIAVDRDREFFAAGVLVKNCDAMGYAAAERPEARELALNEDPRITKLLEGRQPLAALELKEELEIIARMETKRLGELTAWMFSDSDVTGQDKSNRIYWD